MPKPAKRPRDLNLWAKRMVDLAPGDATKLNPDEAKNPAAVELGRRGGLKGGNIRAQRMTDNQRKQSARKVRQGTLGKKSSAADDVGNGSWRHDASLGNWRRDSNA